MLSMEIVYQLWADLKIAFIERGLCAHNVTRIAWSHVKDTMKSIGCGVYLYWDTQETYHKLMKSINKTTYASDSNCEVQMNGNFLAN